MAAEEDDVVNKRSPATSDTLTQPLYRNLDASNVEELETSELESLCMNCHENGVTRLLLTRIPMFHEVIVMSFYCHHCGYSNNEIQDGGTIQTNGVIYRITVSTTEDLNRLVVKGDSASLKIPELDFEVPPNTQKGSINTLEGFIQISIEELEKDQPVRKITHPELATQLDQFIARLRSCLKVETPFTVLIDDPTGNSHVENKQAPDVDASLTIERYQRSDEQNLMIGAENPETKAEASDIDQSNETQDEAVDLKNEVLSFATSCPSCNMSTENRMKIVEIPHFKEVVLMSLSCEWCGHKTSEVKSGSGIQDKGSKITLKITDPSDLSRDILKSESASFIIPELDFKVEPGTLGGQFTTLEGLLVAVRDQLAGNNPFVVGDSSTATKLKMFIDKLNEIIEGHVMGITVILDDPAGNSYLQNTYAPEDDPEMTVEFYERSQEHNEELGLNDMNTEPSIT